jgi:23S rRNA pseudouridine1911/1915/1917 synthase
MDLSRSYIQKLIKSGSIRVNNEPIRANYKIKTDDEITLEIPEPEVLDVVPQDIPLEIIYEDDSIAVINKQPGLVVHPGPGNWDRTLVNGLLFHLKNLSSIGGVIRPGIVHRLDKDTSGLMVVAKNDEAHKHLVELFSTRQIRKVYTAVVVGKTRFGHEVIKQPIARHPKYRHKMVIDEKGREAITEYTVQKVWNTGHDVYSLLEIKLHTGRTHQIRVHLSSAGTPIVGDPIYSKKWEKYRVPYLLLASIKLEFAHPVTKQDVCFEVPLPEHIQDFIKR